MIIIAAFGPFLAAMVTIRIFEGKDKLKAWLRSIFNFQIPVFLYLAGAFFIRLLIGSLQYILYRLLGGAQGYRSARTLVSVSVCPDSNGPTDRRE